MQSPGGAIKLSVVIAATLGLGLGASAFLNYQQHARAEQERKLLQGEIVDLRYQIQQDKLAADHRTATPTPSPSTNPDLADLPTDSPSPSPSAAATPAVLGDTAPAAQTRTVKAAANLRSSASAKAGLVMRVSAGAIATLGSDASGGYQQVTINGKTGYILASYLQ